MTEKLVLGAATSAFAKKIKNLVPKLQLGEKFAIREDTLTDPDATRVFIAPARPPYQGFLPLAAFAKQAKAAK